MINDKRYLVETQTALDSEAPGEWIPEYHFRGLDFAQHEVGTWNSEGIRARVVDLETGKVVYER